MPPPLGHNQTWPPTMITTLVVCGGTVLVFSTNIPFQIMFWNRQQIPIKCGRSKPNATTNGSIFQPSTATSPATSTVAFTGGFGNMSSFALPMVPTTSTVIKSLYFLYSNSKAFVVRMWLHLGTYLVCEQELFYVVIVAIVFIVLLLPLLVRRIETSSLFFFSFWLVWFLFLHSIRSVRILRFVRNCRSFCIGLSSHGWPLLVGNTTTKLIARCISRWVSPRRKFNVR